MERNRIFLGLSVALAVSAWSASAPAQVYSAPGYYGSGYPTYEGRPQRPPPGAIIADDEDNGVERGPRGYAPGIRPPGSVMSGPEQRGEARAMPDDRRAPVSTGSVMPPNAAMPPAAVGGPVSDGEARGANGASVMSLPEEDQPEQGAPKELPANLKRQLVNYATAEPPGTIIVDTANTYLYFVLGNGQAMRYGIGVGRDGFTWAGREKVSRKAEWPDWHPPQEMIERQPYLPRFMAGGPGNPLGARAMYLGKTVYRIHGTNQPSTIGKFVSSGCIRLINEDVEDLYERAKVGTQVVVLSGPKPATNMPVSVAPQAMPNGGANRVEAAGTLPPVR